MAFEELEPIFGEARAEWGKSSGSVPLRRFMIHVFAQDYYHIKFHVTDFHSLTFEALKSVPQLEDLRDSVGIGGSWSEFVEYFISSIKQDVKLVLENNSNLDGTQRARLIAQKAKGMPLVSMSLTKVADIAADDIKENISFGLLNAFRRLKNSSEQERTPLLTSSISTELEKKQKITVMNSSEKGGVSAFPDSNGSQGSPDKRPAHGPASTKVNNRVVPAYRRAKTRGVSLRDTDDDDED